jgi:hypothetical protein
MTARMKEVQQRYEDSLLKSNKNVVVGEQALSDSEYNREGFGQRYLETEPSSILFGGTSTPAFQDFMFSSNTKVDDGDANTQYNTAVSGIMSQSSPELPSRRVSSNTGVIAYEEDGMRQHPIVGSRFQPGMSSKRFDNASRLSSSSRVSDD